MTNTLMEESVELEEIERSPSEVTRRQPREDNGPDRLPVADATGRQRKLAPVKAGRWLRGLWDRNIWLPMVRTYENVVLRRQAEKFYLYFGGHIFFETLRVAVKFDLFSVLDEEGPLTRRQIAERLRIGDQPAKILLLGLTVGGLIKKRGDMYRNSMLAKQLLTRHSPRKVLSYVELEHAVMYKPMHRLYDAIRQHRNVGLDEFPGDEPTVYERLAHQPELEVIFQEAMQELSVQSNQDLARYVDFSEVRHVVDVGGGDGTNAIALVSQWPQLKATILDSPSVCGIADRNIREMGFSGRIDTYAGNCFDDPFPKGADCYLFAHFFTIWSEKKDRLLLKKSFNALPSGGRVILYNMMQNDNEDGPWAAAIGSPYFLAVATGEGMLYTWKEYENWMSDAGFRNVRRFRLPRHHGVISCSKP